MSTPEPPSVASAAPGALQVGTRLGEFERRSVIGVGGFGIVYLAFDHALEREVDAGSASGARRALSFAVVALPLAVAAWWLWPRKPTPLPPRLAATTAPTPWMPARTAPAADPQSPSVAVPTVAVGAGNVTASAPNPKLADAPLPAAPVPSARRAKPTIPTPDARRRGVAAPARGRGRPAGPAGGAACGQGGGAAGHARAGIARRRREGPARNRWPARLRRTAQLHEPRMREAAPGTRVCPEAGCGCGCDRCAALSSIPAPAFIRRSPRP
jgi:hypothetical protein